VHPRDLDELFFAHRFRSFADRAVWSGHEGSSREEKKCLKSMQSPASNRLYRELAGYCQPEYVPSVHFFDGRLNVGANKSGVASKLCNMFAGLIPSGERWSPP
jgi:hypothetical protein